MELNSDTEKNINNDSFSKKLNDNLNLNNSTFSVDRFEGEFAVCENKKTGEMVNIKKSLLPENVKEGSIIKFENGNYILDSDATLQKQEQIKNMVNNLFKK